MMQISKTWNRLQVISFGLTMMSAVLTFALMVFLFINTVFFGPASTDILSGVFITFALIVWTLSVHLFFLWLLRRDCSLLQTNIVATGNLVVVGLSALVLIDAFLLRPHPQSALVMLFLPVLQWVGCAIILLADSVAAYKETNNKPRTRWMRLKPKLILLLLAVAVLFAGWWFLQTPSNDRNWTPNLAKLPQTVFDGETVTVKNIRNTQYRSAEDYTPKYENRTFDLNKIRSVEFVVVPFSSVKIAAHTFLVFGFENGERLAITIEVRKEKGESYSPLRGMLRQCELIYIIADERDVILLRTKYRKAKVLLYPINATPKKVREMFVSMLRRANSLRDQPEFYNTLTNNCTSNILLHFNHINKQKLPANLKALFPGYSDQLAFDLDLIDSPLPFEQLQQQCDITKKANQFAEETNFSHRIRE